MFTMPQPAAGDADSPAHVCSSIQKKKKKWTRKQTSCTQALKMVPVRSYLRDMLLGDNFRWQCSWRFRCTCVRARWAPIKAACAFFTCPVLVMWLLRHFHQTPVFFFFFFYRSTSSTTFNENWRICANIASTFNFTLSIPKLNARASLHEWIVTIDLCEFFF